MDGCPAPLFVIAFFPASSCVRVHAPDRAAFITRGGRPEWGSESGTTDSPRQAFVHQQTFSLRARAMQSARGAEML